MSIALTIPNGNEQVYDAGRKYDDFSKAHHKDDRIYGAGGEYHGLSKAQPDHKAMMHIYRTVFNSIWIYVREVFPVN